MSHDPLLERISQLERSLKRWRLASVCLALLLTGALAVACLFTAMQPAEEPGDFWLMLPWVRARAAREAELRARQEALRALQAVEADRRAAQERQKRAEDEAAKNKPP